jgi:hypothetical protein
MQYSFEAKCVLVMEQKEGEKASKHLQTKFNLDVSPNLDKTQYIDKYDLPTREGAQVLTNVFIQGLIGNIHASNQKGFWNDAEHLRFIISELERGFIEITKIDESTF